MRRSFSPYARFLIIGLLAVGCSRTIKSETPSPSTQTEALQQQRFDDVTITVTGLKYPIGNAFESHTIAFEEATGVNVVFESVPFGDLY